MKHKKSLALLASAAMTVSSVAPAFTSVAMAEGTAKYKDGTYTVTKTVTPDEDEDFDPYDLKVTFIIQDGAVTDVTAEESGDGGNEKYIGWALNGKGGKPGLKEQIIKITKDQSDDTLDAVSKATCSSNAIIDAAKDALEQAKIPETPDTSANKTDLQAAVEEVNAASYEESKYTAESWAALQAALTTANEALANENATQEEVDAAKDALVAAVAALAEAPAVDKTALNDAIANAIAEQGNYTDESWTAYNIALDAAKTVQADETATQEAVNAALEALTKAQNALAEKPTASESVYALMNIPYDEFYKAELNNDIKVDAVASATKNKTRTARLVGGSYHVNADGTDITGVIYPVKIDSAALEKLTQITDDSKLDITVTNRGQTSTTTYEGKDALFGSESYSYYLLSGTEAPAAYKEVTVAEDGSLSFGEIKTEKVTVLSDASAELETSTTYGDYQINVDGLPEEKLENISGVILETTDGISYGLRHLENIWRKSELAFSTGYTKSVHGCPTSWEHYKSIMGKTVNKITYVTQDGEYVINTKLTIPVKDGTTVQAESGVAGDGSVKFTLSKELPEGFDPEYSVNLEGATVDVANGTISYKKAAIGKYTLTIQDKSGKYAALTASFSISSQAFADLKALAAEANELKEDNYTSESWQNFSTELANANQMINSANRGGEPAEDKINAQIESLKKAMGDLAKVSNTVYALMNIPYDEFYKADLEKNNVKVDAMTSATKNKTRTGSLVGGSYHVNEDGTDITGVIYPVKIDKAALENLKQITDDDKLEITVTNRGQTSKTEYKGKDALFESDSYSYYILSETPAAYKEVSVGEDGKLSFGKIETSNVTELSEATAELETSTSYGDYQINVDGLPEEKLENISGVILETTDGISYGLRHLENIWRKSELAFSTGYTKSVHGCPTSWEHYKSIMGKTVNKITYVTQNGEYVINTNLYVPIKTGITATAEGKEGTNQAEVKFSEELPADFSPVYEANGIAITAEGNTLKYEDAKPGKYSVTVSDKNGKYADISAELTVMTKAEGDNFIQMDSAAGNLTSTDENVKVADYVKNITSVTVNGNPYAATGRGATKLFFDNGYLDITAAPFAGGSVAAQDANSTVFAAGAVYNITIQADGYPQMTLNYTVPDTIYAYANLTYGEYWAAEDVQAAGDTSSNEGKDSRGESDKGAFDAVSRATTNHGLHRGSFQQSAVIHTEVGKDFEVSHWSADGKTITLTDGSTITYNKGAITYTEGRTQKTTTMTNYEITGIKYVPVAVSANDFAAFLANRGANHVVVNGGAMAGGFGEMNLQSYTATANVTANTNGLKAVNKNADGSFSFAAAQTGKDSGLLGESRKAASNIEVTVKDANGSYGEFLRVDLKGDGYGALGDKLQTVEWTYYGSDSTYTTPVAHYGTKFAADNWMHKSMGIQLGLTDSIRCTLPAGTDGTGYWTLTVRALGYEDYTVQFQATEANIVKEQVNVKTDFTALQELVAKASEKKESDYTAESWKNFKDELDETNEMIEKGTATQAEINEQIVHLQNAMDNLVTVPGNFDTSKDLVKQAGEKQEGDYTSESWAAFQAELGKLNAMIAAGTAPQSEINAQNAALENAMNALAKKSSSGSSHSSSSSSSSSSTTNNTTNTTTTNNTTVQAAPVSVGGTSPKTGDPTSLLGWMAAGLGSIGGLGALIRKRKK